MANRRAQKKPWTLYKHTSPSGKVYVGITTNIKDRWADKGRNYCTYNSIFKKAIFKYGWDNIKHEILAENLPHDEACALEIALIAYYKKLGISYNITNGGEGMSGMVFSEESRRRMSESQKGRDTTKAVKASLEARKKETPEERKKYANHRGKGWHRSTETRAKISRAAKGRDMSKAIAASLKAGRNIVNKRVVLQIDIINNIVINEFPSITAATKSFGKTSNSIVNCLQGRAKTAFGYKWKYKI